MKSQEFLSLNEAQEEVTTDLKSLLQKYSETSNIKYADAARKAGATDDDIRRAIARGKRLAASSKLNPADAKVASRVTAKKYGGNDNLSWAVFVDGKPMVTGLSADEVPYYKKQALSKLKSA